MPRKDKSKSDRCPFCKPTVLLFSHYSRVKVWCCQSRYMIRGTYSGTFAFFFTIFYLQFWHLEASLHAYRRLWTNRLLKLCEASALLRRHDSTLRAFPCLSLSRSEIVSPKCSSSLPALAVSFQHCLFYFLLKDEDLLDSASHKFYFGYSLCNGHETSILFCPLPFFLPFPCLLFSFQSRRLWSESRSFFVGGPPLSDQANLHLA